MGKCALCGEDLSISIGEKEGVVYFTTYTCCNYAAKTPLQSLGTTVKNGHHRPEKNM